MPCLDTVLWGYLSKENKIMKYVLSQTKTYKGDTKPTVLYITGVSQFGKLCTLKKDEAKIFLTEKIAKKYRKDLCLMTWDIVEVPE